MFTEQQERVLKQLVSESTDTEEALIGLKKHIRNLYETGQFKHEYDPDWLAWFVYLQYKKQLKNENARTSYR
jgi:hypothetical protein